MWTGVCIECGQDVDSIEAGSGVCVHRMWTGCGQHRSRVRCGCAQNVDRSVHKMWTGCGEHRSRARSVHRMWTGVCIECGPDVDSIETGSGLHRMWTGVHRMWTGCGQHRSRVRSVQKMWTGVCIECGQDVDSIEAGSGVCTECGCLRTLSKRSSCREEVCMMLS